MVSDNLKSTGIPPIDELSTGHPDLGRHSHPESVSQVPINTGT